jgi:hypothetical protein
VDPCLSPWRIGSGFEQSYRPVGASPGPDPSPMALLLSGVVLDFYARVRADPSQKGQWPASSSPAFCSSHSHADQASDEAMGTCE